MYSEKTTDDGQRNCPKHVEFYSKNKFEKLVRIIGFIIGMYHDARSHERHMYIIRYVLSRINYQHVSVLITNMYGNMLVIINT
jgi:hypothetical protein